MEESKAGEFGIGSDEMDAMGQGVVPTDAEVDALAKAKEEARDGSGY